tara:strand:- start:173 stop:400 length:228 start_codon:yes stop_codon:yes gene_type:complete
MYKIVIIMFLLNPAAVEDALEVNFKHGKVLEFSRIEHCYEHIHNNLAELKEFAGLEYGPDVPVKSINCFKKNVGV